MDIARVPQEPLDREPAGLLHVVEDLGYEFRAPLLAPAHREHLELRRERDAHPLTRLTAEALEELAGVEVLPAEAVDVGTVRLQRLHAEVEGVGGVHAVPAVGGAGRPDGSHAAPGL